MRRRLVEQGFGADRGFRWRGGEISRLEGLSDAVFAFAVTLLAVSLEVPETFLTGCCCSWCCSTSTR